MNDDVMDTMDPGFFEVARRLEAFADLRLTPSVAATTRLRTSVMTAAHRRAALIQADAALDAAGSIRVGLSAERARPVRGPWRRPAAALLAACLTLGIVAGMTSAARPGGPLYATRLWVEMAILPADPLARADAEVRRLEDRLLEAQQASRDGDGPAVQAALEAYSSILAEAEAGSAGDPAADAVIEATVTRHIAVLTLLVDSVPVAARDAVEHAISSSTKVLDGLDTSGGSGGSSGNGGQSGQPGSPSQPGSTSQPTNDEQPASTGQPTDNVQPGKPATTVRPAKPDDPVQPVKPERTDGPTSPDKGSKESGRDDPDRDQ